MDRKIFNICFGCDEPIWEDESRMKLKVKNHKVECDFHAGCGLIYQSLQIAKIK